MSDLKMLAETEFKWIAGKLDYDGELLFVRYNLTAERWMENPEFSVMLRFFVPFNDNIGLEDKLLNKTSQVNLIEDIIREVVFSSITSIHVMCLTNSMMREFVFYVTECEDTDQKVKEIHQRISQKVTSHEVQCMAVCEPDWRSYKRYTQMEKVCIFIS
ncbi:MAG: DUF695 domain-containing protein [Cyanobacteria bacterium P01_G01_bin.54]